MTKKFLSILLSALLLPSVAQAAFNAPTVTTVRASRGGPSYTQVEITGDMDGTTAISATVAIPLPTKRGAIELLVTGDVDTAVLTLQVFDSGFGFTSNDGSAMFILSETDTVAADLRGTMNATLFETVVTVPQSYVLPPTTLTFRLFSGNAGSNGAITLRATFLHD